MPGRSRLLQRQIRLSARAVVAAERLAEAAGMSAAEMLEMLLLELLESSLPIEGVGPGPGSRTGRRRGKPATVIPIERRRARVTLRYASTLEILRQRSLAARQRSSAACERGKAAREAAERIRARGLRLRPACESA